MKDQWREVALGIVFVAGYIYLLRFLHSFPTRAMLRIEWIEQLPPVVLNVAGWCLWIWHRRSQNPPWRQGVAWLGLIGNALAVCLPFLAFKYDLFVFTRKGGYLGNPPLLPVSDAPHIDPTLHLCLILSAAVLVLGFAAPKRVRFAVVLGGFAMTWLLLSVVAI
ncbi:MAG TPA: hypothetical protein VN901_31930 [Candidatus Acidoferrales bacterium]|nr:hypothetical protein [Candidatus Acidoferrales bacterium]